MERVIQGLFGVFMAVSGAALITRAIAAPAKKELTQPEKPTIQGATDAKPVPITEPETETEELDQ